MRKSSRRLAFAALSLAAPFAMSASAANAPHMALVGGVTGTRATTFDDEHYRLARQVIEKAIAYLRTQQDEATGGWAVPKDPQAPHLPAITALVVQGMLMEPQIDESDPQVARGIDYLLSKRSPDGGFYDRILENYNTSIVLSALSRVNRPEAVAAIKPAQDYLRSLQWAGQTLPDGTVVDEKHPFYGGAGYGNHGRPDNSNLGIMLDALHESGLDCNDPAFQRAVTFLQRTQMLDAVNDMPYADGSAQGGFIYATSINRDQVGVGQSQAEGMVDERLADGSTVSRLRCYGSMTYTGFKSYVYANLDRDDVRVRAAYDWIRRNYTLEENPGIGMQGYYYYLLTFAKALDAWGETTIKPLNPNGSEGIPRDWANDLIDRLAALQGDDGSFVNQADRWMEGDPVLVTAYVVLALQHAID